MKLKNKKTGEIKELKDIMSDMIDNHIVPTLIAIETEWEDYEESEEHWFIRDNNLSVGYSPAFNNAVVKYRKEIGNYFKTKEEAEKAVEKLKAWKLLKDECNIKFNGIIRDDRAMLKGVKLSYDRHNVTFDKGQECMDALHLLFGDE